MIQRKGREPIKDGRAKVTCSVNMKSQAGWWIRRILSAEAAGDLPLHFKAVPVHHLSLYPDAAGGGSNQFRNGIGCVFDVHPRIYSFCRYPDKIRRGIPNKLGHSQANKLSFLESCAALLGMTMCPELLLNNTVYIYSDNSGLVRSFQKGSSRCLYTYSIILAIRALARSFNSRVLIVKVKRCSNVMSSVADMLSKGQLAEAKENMVDSVMGNYSSTFVSWLADPVPTRGLGLAIISELQRKLKLPVFETEWHKDYLPLVKHNDM